VHLRDAGLPLPLRRQRPAPQALIEGQHLYKPVLARHRHGSLGLRLGGLPLAAQLMEPGCAFQGGGEGKRMCQLLRQPQGLLLLV